MNHFARARRAEKVQALLAHTPRTAFAAERLSAFTAHERRVFALGAGVNECSDTTWAALVSAVRSLCDEDGMKAGAETATHYLVRVPGPRGGQTVMCELPLSMGASS